jgi:hypothetical protein
MDLIIQSKIIVVVAKLLAKFLAKLQTTTKTKTKTCQFFLPHPPRKKGKKIGD